MKQTNEPQTKIKPKIAVKWKRIVTTVLIQCLLLLFGVFFGIRLNDAFQGKSGWLDVICSLLPSSRLALFYMAERYIEKVWTSNKQRRQLNDRVGSFVNVLSDSVATSLSLRYEIVDNPYASLASKPLSDLCRKKKLIHWDLYPAQNYIFFG